MARKKHVKAIKDKIHYSIRKIDSYNKQFNFVVSPRCLGKSTAVWFKCYKQFRKYNNTTLVLRRLQADITESYIYSIQKMINKFLDENKMINFTFKKGDTDEGVVDVFIGNELFIKVAALSCPKSRLKSLFMENIFCIVFDEFICDNAIGEKYLKDEESRFREIYTTFAREGDDVVKCYFMGNPYSVFNPYWQIGFYGIDVDLSAIKPDCFLVGKNYAIECAKPSPRLIEWLINKGLYDPELDDEYNRYAFGGIAINDKNIVINKQQPEGYKLKYVFALSRSYVGIYVDNRKRETIGYDVGKFWCRILKEQEVSNNRKIYAIDFNNLVHGSRLITTDQKSLLWRLKQCISKRDISYQNISVAYLVQTLYKSL